MFGLYDFLKGRREEKILAKVLKRREEVREQFLAKAMKIMEKEK